MVSAAREGGDMDTKIEGRKKRVIMGYKATMLAYLAVGLSSAIRGGITKNFLHMIAGYIVMPAGISYILISAASNNRLNSDTYKRLNLSLIEYGLVGLVIVSLGGLKRRNAVMALAFALSVINSIKGFAYGVLGKYLTCLYLLDCHLASHLTLHTHQVGTRRAQILPC